jgi:hypothetical protein
VRTSAERSGDLASDDVFAELERAVGAAAGDDAAVAALAEALAPLAAKLPAGLDWDPTAPETVRDLLADIERELPALLFDGGAA